MKIELFREYILPFFFKWGINNPHNLYFLTENLIQSNFEKPMKFLRDPKN